MNFVTDKPRYLMGFLLCYSKTTTGQGPRSSSSSYLYPDNISDWPQLHGDSEDEELYIELVSMLLGVGVAHEPFVMN